jgi:leucyl-tRNA synthetase
MHRRFDHKSIEEKWQNTWAQTGIYTTSENTDKPKCFVLDMFPYPSGEGLHVGHPKGYIATDIYSRFKRMTGHEVLHPMGWDAFGLPAENYAIKNKVHPRVAVEKNIENFKHQLAQLGFDYDWGREINTTDPEFYKWTQWIFIQLFKKGLAKESYEPINWCPGCQTGLANEDLEADGTCERCDSVVEQRPMRQWVLNIKAYADRMLEDLDTLQWPEHIKEAQRNWIGRSEGAEIEFKLSTGDTVKVFTTRPDTLFGATYMVLAPEHELVTKNSSVILNGQDVAAYIKEAANKKEMDRLDDTKEKTGVQLEGITATNPATKEEIPVYIADYVLASYGTGAIMAVPAHDERDFAFAKKFNIEIRDVVRPKTSAEVAGTGIFLRRKDGQLVLQKRDKFAPSSPEKISTFGGTTEPGETQLETLQRELLEELEFDLSPYLEQVRFLKYHASDLHPGKVEAMYILENVDDSAFVLHEGEKIVTVHSLDDIADSDKSLFIQSVTDQTLESIQSAAGVLVNSKNCDGLDSEQAKTVIVEKVGGQMTSTYKIRDWVFSRQRYWGEPIPIIHCEQCGPVTVPEDQLPVTLPEVENYEPAGDGQSPLANIDEWVNTTCPKCGEAGKRETNTMPQWAGSSWYYLRYMDPKNSDALVSKENEAYWSPVDVYVGGDHAVRHLIYARFWHKFLYDIDVVSTIEPFQRLEFLGFILAEDGRKMSKRWGNVINPNDIVELVGADTMRVYEMFMGPFENTIAWSQDGLAGARRFLERVNGLSEHITPEEPKATTTALHKTIKKVSEDIEGFKFNTAVSAMMIFINQAEKEGLSLETYDAFLRLLAPFAPHITEELWRDSGNADSVHRAEFPVYEDSLAKDEEVTIGVQINGKMRGEITISPEATQDEAMELTKQHPNLAEKINTETITKIIYVPGRILNILQK